jgi:hypothetical protein
MLIGVLLIRAHGGLSPRGVKTRSRNRFWRTNDERPDCSASGGGVARRTDGNLDLTVDATTSGADMEFLKSIGYRVEQGFVANANALLFNPDTRVARAAAR